MSNLDSGGVKRMDLEEFRQAGYLQEVNRRFFHPLGMALEVIVNDEGRATALGGIWDDRDDAEGNLYGPGMIEVDKIERVQNEWEEKARHRMDTLGYVIQGVEA